MWAHLGAMLAHLGAMLAHLGAMLAQLEAMLAHLGAMLAHLGGYVGPPWGYVGPSWGLCCPMLTHLEPQDPKNRKNMLNVTGPKNTVNYRGFCRHAHPTGGRRQGAQPLSPTERRELQYGKDTARGTLGLRAEGGKLQDDPSSCTSIPALPKFSRLNSWRDASWNLRARPRFLRLIIISSK